MNLQVAFAQTRLINALLSYQQAPSYPRISWCGLGSPSITGFPSILKAEDPACHSLEGLGQSKVRDDVFFAEMAHSTWNFKAMSLIEIYP
ncbi:hypothetical protein Tco_0359876 [Tanacetum coccineum]